MGHRSDRETTHWLLSQVRPDLVPPLNSCKIRRKSTNSINSPAGNLPLSTVPRPVVRATVVQASTVFYDTPATLDKAERLIAGAAAYGSQIVVFPEAFVGGYPHSELFNAMIDGHSTEDKELDRYHASAINVPESNVWCRGEIHSPPMFDTLIGKVGGLLCWDNRMPHLRTELYTKGIEIYCMPTAEVRELWVASMTHIAWEGSCFVLSANQFCRRKDYLLPPETVFEDSNGDTSLDRIICAGGSVIVSPSGTILAGSNFQGESLISADLDLGEIARSIFEFNGIVPNSVLTRSNAASATTVKTEVLE